MAVAILMISCRTWPEADGMLEDNIVLWVILTRSAVSGVNLASVVLFLLLCLLSLSIC